MPSHDFRKPRLFVDTVLESGTAVALERDQSNYLGNVLRLKAGDSILVFNGRDGEWLASITGRKIACRSFLIYSPHSSMPGSITWCKKPSRWGCPRCNRS